MFDREGFLPPARPDALLNEEFFVKEAWVHLDEWSKEMVTTALEGGADALVIPLGWQERVKALGRVVTVSPDGDMKPGEDVFFEVLQSSGDEERIGRLLSLGPVALEAGRCSKEERTHAREWEVIPLENLIARGGRLFVPVYSKEDVELALGILEKGVAGVVIHAASPEELKEMLGRVKTLSKKEHLREAIIESITQVGIGDRVCVDTCTLMDEGEGLLIGNSSAFLFLVQAEVKQNPYVAPRPFRVNAGPVHAYVRVPDGRTKYLSELHSGDPVLIVGAKGSTEVATVGRVKIERRPLLLIEAACESHKGTILLQNAETIRLTEPDGSAKSVVDLKPGDSVMVAIESAGRHCGMKVDETIRES
jgi:3-dehydroquinate synthase II